MLWQLQFSCMVLFVQWGVYVELGEVLDVGDDVGGACGPEESKNCKCDQGKEGDAGIASVVPSQPVGCALGESVVCGGEDVRAAVGEAEHGGLVVGEHSRREKRGIGAQRSSGAFPVPTHQLPPGAARSTRLLSAP